jgi:hypothetical protein
VDKDTQNPRENITFALLTKSLFGISHSRSLLPFLPVFLPETRYIGAAMRLVSGRKTDEKILTNSFGGKIQTNSKKL